MDSRPTSQTLIPPLRKPHSLRLGQQRLRLTPNPKRKREPRKHRPSRALRVGMGQRVAGNSGAMNNPG